MKTPSSLLDLAILMTLRLLSTLLAKKLWPKRGMSGETLSCICAVVTAISVCLFYYCNYLSFSQKGTLQGSWLIVGSTCDSHLGVDVLEYLLPLVPPSLLSVTNESGSPAMHYAVANNNTECVKALVNWPEEQGGDLPLLKVSCTLLLSLSLLFSVSVTSCTIMGN